MNGPIEPFSRIVEVVVVRIQKYLYNIFEPIDSFLYSLTIAVRNHVRYRMDLVASKIIMCENIVDNAPFRGIETNPEVHTPKHEMMIERCSSQDLFQGQQTDTEIAARYCPG